jgi:acetyl esterase/lipase
MEPITVTYRQAAGVDVKLDVYAPVSSGAAPAVLFFHGGGLLCGNRNDLYFPTWLKGRLRMSAYIVHESYPNSDAALQRGWLFLSADYHLLVPATAHDQIADVRALGGYLSSGQLSSHLPVGLSLDLTRLFVAGVSAGGYMSYLYALHATPKPKAILSLFALGGDLLTDRYALPNPDGIPFYGGRISFTTVNAFLGIPEGSPVPVTSDSPIKLGPTGPYCEDGRSRLFVCLAQEGTFLDHFAGQKGLAASLGKLPASARAAAIPEAHHDIFPQLRASELPPTILIHGDEDTAVFLHESEVTFAALQRAGVKSELVVVKGATHGLRSASNFMEDAPGVPEAYAKSLEFLEGCL